MPVQEEPERLSDDGRTPHACSEAAVRRRAGGTGDARARKRDGPAAYEFASAGRRERPRGPLRADTTRPLREAPARVSTPRLARAKSKGRTRLSRACARRKEGRGTWIRCPPKTPARGRSPGTRHAQATQGETPARTRRYGPDSSPPAPTCRDSRVYAAMRDNLEGARLSARATPSMTPLAPHAHTRQPFNDSPLPQAPAAEPAPKPPRMRPAPGRSTDDGRQPESLARTDRTRTATWTASPTP